jgi:threonine synthase
MWEDFGFKAPDNIIAPVGAGSSLLGCAFGFRELKATGQIPRLPRLVAAQPLNCSPIDASSTAGVDTPIPRAVLTTIAEGTAIKRPLRLREIIAALRESEGQTIALTETGSSTRSSDSPGWAFSPSRPAQARLRPSTNSPPPAGSSRTKAPLRC